MSIIEEDLIEHEGSRMIVISADERWLVAVGEDGVFWGGSRELATLVARYSVEPVDGLAEGRGRHGVCWTADATAVATLDRLLEAEPEVIDDPDCA